MPKSYSGIWLYAHWSTKDQVPMLDKSVRYSLFNHIKQYARENNIHLDMVNGTRDHVHCLIRLKPVQSPSDLIGKIKGESSYWINRNMGPDEKFAWQQGYGIFSVSERDIQQMRTYIYNQEKHHQEMNYDMEIKRLAKLKVRVS